MDSQSVALTGMTGGAVYAMAETVGYVVDLSPPRVALGLCVLAAVAMAPDGWLRSPRQWITTLFAALALFVTALGTNGADVKLQKAEAGIVADRAHAQQQEPEPTPRGPREPW